MTQEGDDSPLHEGSLSAVFISWIEYHLNRTSESVMDLRSLSVDLVRRMDDDPSSVELEDLMYFKNRILEVLSIAEEQSQCMNMLKKLHKDSNDASPSVLDFTNLRGTLSILICTAESTERMGLRLEKRSISLRQQYDSYQQDKINHRLAVLTVLSAVFMPLTFIAGIYGMNFENMPELGYENSYYILLATLLAIAISMMVFFHTNGWLE